MEITPEVRAKLLGFQRTEITEFNVYTKLARAAKSEEEQGSDSSQS